MTVMLLINLEYYQGHYAKSPQISTDLFSLLVCIVALVYTITLVYIVYLIYWGILGPVLWRALLHVWSLAQTLQSAMKMRKLILLFFASNLLFIVRTRLTLTSITIKLFTLDLLFLGNRILLSFRRRNIRNFL